MKKIDDLFERIIQGSSDLKMVMDVERTKLQRLIDAHDQYVNERHNLGLKMGMLRSEATTLISEGRSTDKVCKQEREAKIEADRLDSLIKELVEIAIPAQTKVVQESQEKLRIKLQSLIKELKSEAIGFFEAKIKEATDLQNTWIQGLTKLHSIFGIVISDSPFEMREFILLAGQRSPFWALERQLRGE